MRTLCPATPPAVSQALRWVYQNNIKGDYHEYGVFEGYCLWHAQKNALDPDMRFFGFDSFRGLPQPEGIDDTGDFKEGQYATSLREVVAHLDTAGVDWTKTFLVPGMFEQSLRHDLYAMVDAPVAIALIDCDLYFSTVLVLKFLTPLLRNGTVLLFDDWNCFGGRNDRGERRAFREWLDENSQWRARPFMRFGWHGHSFIMKEQK